MSEEFKLFKLTYHPAQIAVLKSVLDSEDIPYMIQGDNFAALYPSSFPFLSGFRLRVRQEHAEQVQEILDKLAERVEPLEESDWEEDGPWKEGEDPS
ncbi:MAG TPA: hypothetical protein VLV83_22310 [Acidobacteriota bacterium]|nr:hypothetical protein [Acidobacteriota bacterium]